MKAVSPEMAAGYAKIQKSLKEAEDMGFTLRPISGGVCQDAMRLFQIDLDQLGVDITGRGSALQWSPRMDADADVVISRGHLEGEPNIVFFWVESVAKMDSGAPSIRLVSPFTLGADDLYPTEAAARAVAEDLWQNWVLDHFHVPDSLEDREFYERLMRSLWLLLEEADTIDEVALADDAAIAAERAYRRWYRREISGIIAERVLMRAFISAWMIYRLEVAEIYDAETTTEPAAA